MARGQVELIIILGIVIVGIVAVYWAFQSGLISPQAFSPISQEQQVVQQSVTAFIQEGAGQTIKNISTYGGYLNEQAIGANSVQFLGKPAPYWMKGGQVRVPDIKSNFVSGLTAWLSANKDTFASSIPTETTLGTPVVSAEMLDNQIQLQVSMPTVVKGNAIPQPYKVSVNTRLGQIADFANNFVNYEKDKRFFEWSMLTSMIVTPFDNDVQKTPFLVSLTECGTYFSKSWDEMKPDMENVIKSTLGHVYMPGKLPPQAVAERMSSAKYALPALGGKQYSEISVSFFTPDNFELDRGTLQFSPDPISAVATPIPQMAECQSDPIYVNYLINYPAIVVAEDPLTGNLFRFAFDVYIKNNAPANWADSGYTPTAQQEICTNPACSSSVSVVDSAGNPLGGVALSFMGCPIGTTDSTGTASANAPCGVGPLTASSDGYDRYSSPESSENVFGKTITLYRLPTVTLHMYEVNIQNDSFTKSYSINPSGVQPINTLHTPEILQLNFVNINDQTDPMAPKLAFGADTANVQIRPITWVITGQLFHNNVPKGGFTELFATLENTSDLYIYVPYLLNFEGLSDDARLNATLAFSNMLFDCGIGPVTSQPAELRFCTVGWDEVFE